MEDLASRVALVGKASPLLPDKRCPWPMMWNGFDWLSLIPQQSEPGSSLGARCTTVTLSDISYFTPTTMMAVGSRTLTSSSHCSTFHTSLLQQSLLQSHTQVSILQDKSGTDGFVPSRRLTTISTNIKTVGVVYPNLSLSIPSIFEFKIQKPPSYFISL